MKLYNLIKNQCGFISAYTNNHKNNNNTVHLPNALGFPSGRMPTHAHTPTRPHTLSSNGNALPLSQTDTLNAPVTAVGEVCADVVE